MKGLQNLIVLGIILILFPAFLMGINNSRITSYPQTVPNIVLGGGVTSYEVTLTKALFGNDVVNVTSITTSLSDALENPAASTYVTATKKLTVIGLKESATRTLVVTYNYGSLDSTSDTFMSNLPIFLIAGGLVLASIGIWAKFHE